jgi:hypothetical protein
MFGFLSCYLVNDYIRLYYFGGSPMAKIVHWRKGRKWVADIEKLKKASNLKQIGRYTSPTGGS